MSSAAELSCQEVLHCANRSYEKLLHSSLDDDSGSGCVSPSAASRGAAASDSLGGKPSSVAGGAAAAAAAAGSSSVVNSSHLQFANEVLASCRCCTNKPGAAAAGCAGAGCLAARSHSPSTRSVLRSSTPAAGYKGHAFSAGSSSAADRYSSTRQRRVSPGRSPSPTVSTTVTRVRVEGSSLSPTSPKASANLPLSPLGTGGGVQAAVESIKLSPVSNGGKSSLSSPGSSHDYSHVSTDNIRELQSIRYSLKHVLHGDMAGVEELLTSKLANIKRQESASFETAVRSSADVTQLINTSLHSENQLLRDTLDRERYRRKQFEKQTETLQGRLGEEQEQFTAALAALKKKDGMIDQLDKTLAKVVEGWQGHEGETQRYIEQLEKTQRQLSGELSDQRELVAGLEMDLASAVEDLAREQERASLAAFEKNNKIQLLEEELRRLSDSLETERSRTHRLELERSATAEGRDRVEQQLQTLQMTLADERAAFQEREQELVAKIDEISGIQITVLENEQKKAAEQERHLLTTEAKLGLALRDVQNLTIKLEETELDKERNAADLATLKAKHEAQLKQQEADLRLQTADVVLRLRQEWAERLSEREAELSGIHRQQVTELHERHARQTGELTARHHSELAELRARYQLQVAELGHKIDELEEEVHSLRYTKRKMEAQSKEMTTRLQSMMTLHASEALKILTNTTPSPPTTSGALALKAEVTTALSHHALQRRPAGAIGGSSDRLQLTAVAHSDSAHSDKVTLPSAATVDHGPPQASDCPPYEEDKASLNEEQGTAAAAKPRHGGEPQLKPFANGDDGSHKEEEGTDNGGRYDEDDRESVASTDTYGNTPRGGDDHGGAGDDSHGDTERQQALQTYIQKLLTQAPGQLTTGSGESDSGTNAQQRGSSHTEGEQSATGGAAVINGGSSDEHAASQRDNLTEDLAQLVARYHKDPQLAPNLEDFLAYLHDTQNAAKDRAMLSGGSRSAAKDPSRKKSSKISSDNGQVSPRSRKSHGQVAKPTPWRC